MVDRPLLTAVRRELKRRADPVWRDARYREHRYAALLLTGERRYRDYQTLTALPLTPGTCVDVRQEDG